MGSNPIELRIQMFVTDEEDLRKVADEFSELAFRLPGILLYWSSVPEAQIPPSLRD